ncbi:hypothetical protein ACKRZS_006463 [Fusarium odoratissimum]|uniref:Uncharacterized protein n=3 Tax=Fusarium oxysporum species complex TaxID=171631 RepID=N1S478_FUSC4|nr:uncharacterized protein FOIG_14880 [Fusarium odoratissimum NRRL 54006]EMT69355.1 hypothetical protein FOC4_g10001309 [Fusarium odoratissimum]KAH7204786.1 hypothetical protein DER44DRAFT_811976 [Fusarium oxysporum]KAK2129075.1 hypothetical protein NOF04DRAFT_16343 [Fusarium oxysporum II5]TXC01954.1 hypothetical protein FocTR4_00007887 [Fusarium oxysporum f. sp. cubense]EXL91998.1 hypothetical protein FOIG_14880 [Fusarium odoratissimum NRRL 54006]
MASRELLVVILNHTNEELNTEPEWPTLVHGQFIKDADLPPPQAILAGESGMLRCKSNHLGGGVEGSITYRVVGFGPRNEVTFSWSVPYVGVNKFSAASAIPNFQVQTLGGHGNQAVVVFVFEPSQKADGGMEDGGVLAAIAKYPLECAEGPLNGFNHS